VLALVLLIGSCFPAHGQVSLPADHKTVYLTLCPVMHGTSGDTVGYGSGLELETVLASRFRNLSLVLRGGPVAVQDSLFSPSGMFGFPPSFYIGMLGVRYYPGIEMRRGFFVGDYLTVAYGRFTLPGQGPEENSIQVGPGWEAGYRWVHRSGFLLQTSIGLSLLYLHNSYGPGSREAVIKLPEWMRFGVDFGMNIGWSF